MSQVARRAQLGTQLWFPASRASKAARRTRRVAVRRGASEPGAWRTAHPGRPRVGTGP